MYKPRHDCIYFTEWDKCNHLDMPRGIFGRGKPCILKQKGVAECSMRIGHARPKGPPGPPPSFTSANDDGGLPAVKNYPTMPPVKKPAPRSRKIRRDTC